MFIPYFNVTPVAPVFLALYEPAKSTKKNFAVIKPSSFWAYELFSVLYKSSMRCCSIKIVKIAWDLEEASFINVAAVVLLYPPFYKSRVICYGVVTFYYVTP